MLVIDNRQTLENALEWNDCFSDSEREYLEGVLKQCNDLHRQPTDGQWRVIQEIFDRHEDNLDI